MTEAMRRPASSVVSRALAQNRLGIWYVWCLVVAAAAPMTVLNAQAPTAWAVTGVVGLPLAYVVTFVVLALFAVGYTAMARHITNAGAFYAYWARGLGRIAGVVAALVALVAYNAMQISLYGGLGVVAQGLAHEWLGFNAPWWLFSLAAWALIAVLGVLRVDINGRVLAVLVTAEIVLVLVFDVIMGAHPYSGQLGLAGLSPTYLFAGGTSALALGGIAVAAFTGFEDSANYSEEARQPGRTVRLATYLALGLTVVLYAGGTWAMSSAAGTGNIVHASATQSTNLMFYLVGQHLHGATSTVLLDAGQLLLLTSLFGCALPFHNTIARYAFALGRERVLPRAFGRTNPRTKAPMIGSLGQSALAFIVIVMVAILGGQPLVQLGFWLGSFSGLGVLILMFGTCFAVIVFFARNRDASAEENAWRTLIAPLLAILGLGTLLVATLSNYATVLGVPKHSPLTWVVPTVFGAAIALGIVWALLLRVLRQDVYGGIGMGSGALARYASRPIADRLLTDPTDA